MSGLDPEHLHTGWRAHLEGEFGQPYMESLKQFLEVQISEGKVIYPQPDEYFNALNCTPLAAVKVVILGQDPYHGSGQAHGLCFSVPRGNTIPPSLRNIYKEIQSDLGFTLSEADGELTGWAEQGVLLLNSVLTVESEKAGSHQGRGWETFTDKIIELVSRERENCVFLLWGGYAQKKGKVIDAENHLVLESSHPSPLSSYRGFLGCKHFSKCNDYLQKTGQAPINWQ